MPAVADSSTSPWTRAKPGAGTRLAAALVAVPQHPEHPTHLGEGGAAAGLDRGQRSLRGIRVRPQPVQPHAGLDGDGGHRVRHDVVQLAGDPQPLLVDRPTCHRGPLGLEPRGPLGVDLRVGPSSADQLGDGDHHRERDGVEEEVAQRGARDRQVRQDDQPVADDDGDESGPPGIRGQDRVRRQRHPEPGRRDAHEQRGREAAGHHGVHDPGRAASYGEWRSGADGNEVLDDVPCREVAGLRDERLEPEHQECSGHEHAQGDQVAGEAGHDRMPGGGEVPLMIPRYSRAAAAGSVARNEAGWSRRTSPGTDPGWAAGRRRRSPQRRWWWKAGIDRGPAPPKGTP